MIIAEFVAAVLIGYLLGSIPFGVIISKRSAGVDVRNYGSGKTGATNVARVAGRKAAVLVILLDALKGLLAVVFAGLIFGESWLVGSAQVLAALAAIAGHSGRYSLNSGEAGVLPPSLVGCWLYVRQPHSLALKF